MRKLPHPISLRITKKPGVRRSSSLVLRSQTILSPSYSAPAERVEVERGIELDSDRGSR